MKLDTKLIQSLNVGVALVQPDTWTIVAENARFFQWFPPDENGNGDIETLSDRLPEMDLERAEKRLTSRRPFRFETETRRGARTITVEIELRPSPDESSSEILVECHDVSKRKQAEYMLESYSEISEKRARELQKEKDRVEKLLLNIMPKSVYEEMRDFGTATPQRFESASILMLDFVDFTEMAVAKDPSGVVAELNDIFSAFDRIVELFGCERIKTMGDAYMAVSGVPEKTPEHASNIAKVALRMRRYLEKRNAAHPEEWRCRIGINSGPVIGSIVGIQKYVYDIFGPGVNLAARMETCSEPMQITLNHDTYELIQDEFILSERGDCDVKGFGPQKLYTLDGEVGRGR